jgi:limonene-1,2-epoxide hydrolase
MSASDCVRSAIAAIDEANRADPTPATIRGRTGPKELLHAELVTEWVTRLAPEAGDALLIAARAHHLRRWTVPRATYPVGRAGYLKWRASLHRQHAAELGELLAGAGCDPDTITRAQALVRKDGLGRGDDTEVQVLEDALCLVFLETQFADVAARLETDTLARVIVKTAGKMSAAGRTLIAEIPLGAGARRLLDEAFARDVVARYLGALPAHDWPALRATLASDVERIGPYGDTYRGSAEYSAFLESTVTALGGYELVVERIMADGGRVAVELHETVANDGARLRTDECVVFDVHDARIARVAVYLRSSVVLDPGPLSP